MHTNEWQDDCSGCGIPDTRSPRVLPRDAAEGKEEYDRSVSRYSWLDIDVYNIAVDIDSFRLVLLYLGSKSPVELGSEPGKKWQ